MSVATHSTLPELGMYEAGHDGEYEEEFFSSLARLARRAAKNPTLRRIGLTAARQAASAIPSVAASVGKPGSPWSTLGRDLGTTVSNQLLSWIPEREGEYEVNPIAKVYPAAVTAGAMEHLGRMAAETEDEAHAEAMIGASVPYLMSLAQALAPYLARATPQLIKGAANMTRVLRADPATQPLVRVVPGIMRGAVASLARQAGAGQPPSPPAAVRALATQAARTLTNPNRCVRAYQRSQALDRGYHQAIGQ